MVIVIGSFLIMATAAVFVNTGSLFQRYVVADLGITVSQYNLGVTIGSLTGIIGSLLIGPLIDRCSAHRHDGRRGGCGPGLFLYSTMDALWQLYVYRFIAGFIIVAGTRLLVSVLIANWFKKKQGLALAIALAGSGLGGALLSPAIRRSSAARAGVSPIGAGAMCVVLTLPIVLPFSHRSRPTRARTRGGADCVKSRPTPPKRPRPRNICWKESAGSSRRSAPFWVMVLGFVAMGLVNGCILTNQVSNMTSITVNGTEIVTAGIPEWASVVLSANLVTVVFASLSRAGCTTASASRRQRL
ncbi:MAG: MFS transporter [Eggerthellaceae bacterium]